MPADLGPLLADLAAESAEVTALLARLTPADWTRATPAAGWSITDQVTHLAYFDDEPTFVHAARSVGLRAHLFTTAAAFVARLRELGLDVVVPPAPPARFSRQ